MKMETGVVLNFTGCWKLDFELSRCFDRRVEFVHAATKDWSKRQPFFMAFRTIWRTEIEGRKVLRHSFFFYKLDLIIVTCSKFGC